MRFGTALAAVSGVLCSNVLDLTESTFQGAIEQHDTLMVEFFAPWCGHCKKLAPEYESAADALNEEDPPIRIAKVDCTANGELCQKYGVSGYPTIKMFKGAEESGKYEGARNADGITAYMRKQSGPASTAIDSTSKWEKVSQNKQTIIVGFFEDYESGNGQVFQKVASALRDDFRFAHSTDSAVVKAAEQEEGKIVLYRPRGMKNKFEAGEVIYTGEKFTVGLIKTWIKENALGSCPIATMDNLRELKRPLVMAFYKVDYNLDPKGTQYWRNRVMKVGQDFSDMNLAVADNKKFQGMINSELNGASWSFDKPKVVIFDDADKKYIMEEEFSTDGKSLRAFIEKFNAGEVEAWIKSEDVPAEQGALKKVVGKNWDDIVMKNDADVFIKMYAPWCGHCKSMAPAWEEFAQKMEGDDGIVVADFDATANDPGHPSYSASGYPTLYWAPAGDKSNPKKYQGGRSVADFEKWVKENRSTPAKDEL